MDDYAYAKTTAMFNKTRSNIGTITSPLGVTSLLGVFSKIGMGHPSIITFLRCISSDDYESFTLSGAFNMHVTGLCM